MSLIRSIYLSKIGAHAALCCACIALLLLIPPAIQTSQAQNFDYAQDGDTPNEFILRVILPPKWLISEAIFAYEKQGTYYLPLTELAEGFEFLAEGEIANQAISGFAGAEENTYSIDGKRGELTIRGNRETLPANAILDSEYLATDDLYVSLEVLNKMWPVTMNLDLPALGIKVTAESEEDFAFIKKRERQQRKDLALARQEERNARKKLLPRRDNPYSILGKPAIDYQATYRFDDDTDELTGDNIFNGVQHIGKFLTEFSANFKLNAEGEIERPDSIRFRASRQSVGSEYLVPHVRRVEFGDVNVRQRELISNTETGRGIIVSNDNRQRSNQFDQITLEGTGPPGWEIEVYNNEELIRIGVVPEDGQFFFEDVVLNFGNNKIKILLFGPQGQVREQIEDFSAGGNMLSPGQFTYEAGVLDSERDFILLDNDPRTTPRGLVKNIQTSYGLTRWATVFGNYTETPDADKNREYLTVGGVFNTPAGLVEAEAYNELGGGNALSLGMVTGFKGIRSNLGVAFFNDFESEDSGFGTNRKTFEADAQVNTKVNIASVPIGLIFQSTHTERVAIDPLTTLNTSQTFSRGPVRLSHNTTTRLSDYQHQSSTAGFTTTVRDDPWQLRGNLNYTIHPIFDISTINSELRYKPKDVKYQAAINAGHNFTNDTYNAGLQGGYDFDTVLASAEANYQRGTGWEFVLRATTSISPYTPDGSYGLSSKQRRNEAPVRARVFLDNDMDGEFGENDEPIEGARIAIGNGTKRATTDENGVLLASHAPYRLSNIQVDKASLQDPYYVPTQEGFSTVLSRGSVVEALFPIIESGSIEGTVYRQHTDKFVSGLTLQLVNAEGESINEVVSAFDGFYAFEFVPPGTYSIRAEASQGANLLNNQAEVDQEDLYVFGHDLYLESNNSAPAVSSEPLNNNIYGPFQPTPAEPYGPFLEDINASAGDEIEEPIDIAPIIAVKPAIKHSQTNFEAFGPQQNAQPAQLETGGLYSLIK